MIKQCTPEVAKEFADKAFNGEFSSLKIEKANNSFYVEYEYALEPMKDVKLENRLYISSALKQFASMLMIDKVYDFYLYFEPASNKCIVNTSYTLTNDEITRDLIVKQMGEQLNNVMTMARTVGIEGLKTNDLFERVNKVNGPAPVVGGHKSVKSDNKQKYREATLESVIKKMLEVIL